MLGANEAQAKKERKKKDPRDKRGVTMRCLGYNTHHPVSSKHSEQNKYRHVYEVYQYSLLICLSFKVDKSLHLRSRAK